MIFYVLKMRMVRRVISRICYGGVKIFDMRCKNIYLRYEKNFKSLIDLISKTETMKDRIYDLERRTCAFGVAIINFCKKVPRGPITYPLITQLVKAGTSVGANYCEADDAISKKDFRFKIGIVKKESRECCHFIRMIVAAYPELEQESRILLQEEKELNLIFNAIFRKVS